MKNSFSIQKDLEAMGVKIRSRGEGDSVVPTNLPTDLPVSLTESTPAPVSEGVRMKLQGGRLVKTRTMRHSAAEKAKWRQAARKPGAKAARRKLAKKPATKRKARLRAALMHHESTTPAPSTPPITSATPPVLTGALAEAEALLTRHQQDQDAIALKGFAEVGLNADLLSRAFTVFGTVYKNDELLGLAEEYRSIGDQAYAIAENLQTDLRESVAIPDQTHLTEVYNGMADVLMDGFELYEVMGEELAEQAERQSLGN